MSILEVKNFNKSFGDVEVLRGIDFELKKGEVLAIIGPSGGGKTTLLRCINFLERAEEGIMKVKGKVIFDGKNSRMTEAELRQNRLHFGLVFQQFNLFPQYTAVQNIVLAPNLLKKADKKTNKKNALRLLKRVGLADKADNYPCELSGGQQQRVAIARALAMNPDILCFDEPTSSLDPEITGEVLRVIKQLADENTTMIIVTHEMGFAKEVADKVIFIDEGKIVEQGDPKVIFDNPNTDRLKNFLGSMLRA
ncbi:MAG: amino acid ABC transporter ATP-binding protein [Clostridiales bacterium]|nr:amino acid ABC transporter ATP-binding protein [Clostridiales bacterium]